MVKVGENLEEIQKNFELMQILNTKVQMDQTIIKAYKELSIFFRDCIKILLKKNKIFKIHFKDFFKIINLEGQAFRELIERREKLKEKYMLEKSELIYNQLGYVDKVLMTQLKKMISEYRIRYLENINCFDSKYYPLINDEVGIWSNMETFCMNSSIKNK